MRTTPRSPSSRARVRLAGRWTRRLAAVAVLAPVGVMAAATQTPTMTPVSLTGGQGPTESAQSRSALSSDVLPVALKHASVPSSFERSSLFRATPDLGVPKEAVKAYRFAESVMQRANPSCGIDWSLLAAIGDVESDHGRYGGAVVRPDGTSAPQVLGPRLDGSSGFASIADTDDGQLDGDRRWDRAVGPMQFIPSTWSVVGSDADGDGVRDPHDVDDAALSAAVYLCSGGGDLSTTQDQRAAVYRYNHSKPYVDLVLRLAAAYADGTLSLDLPSAEPSGTPVDIPTLSKPVDHSAHPARPPVDTSSGPSTPTGGQDSSQRRESRRPGHDQGGKDASDGRTAPPGPSPSSDPPSEGADTDGPTGPADSPTPESPSSPSESPSPEGGSTTSPDGGTDGGGSGGDGDGGGGPSDEESPSPSSMTGLLDQSGDGSWTVDGQLVDFGDAAYLAADALDDFDGADGVESNLGELETLTGQEVTVAFEDGTQSVVELNGMAYR